MPIANPRCLLQLSSPSWQARRPPSSLLHTWPAVFFPSGSVLSITPFIPLSTSSLQHASASVLETTLSGPRLQSADSSLGLLLLIQLGAGTAGGTRRCLPACSAAPWPAAVYFGPGPGVRFPGPQCRRAQILLTARGGPALYCARRRVCEAASPQPLPRPSWLTSEETERRR
ncbi:hypothetical protein F4818DRAFT_433035 [Hypoxylon cercidicola]|nr:hypothetical protein F4818DRAFT_433035 [Hypoxylon cercidicola]